jgi:hypothetical protein
MHADSRSLNAREAQSENNPSGANTTTELENTTTPDNNGNQLGMF